MQQQHQRQLQLQQRLLRQPLQQLPKQLRQLCSSSGLIFVSVDLSLTHKCNLQNNLELQTKLYRTWLRPLTESRCCVLQADSAHCRLSIALRRGFHPNATHATNLRNLRMSEITQAPANRNRTVLYPAELEFLRFRFKKKSIVQILVRFYRSMLYSNGAVMRSYDVRLSVRPSVRLSVTLVDCDHIR